MTTALYTAAGSIISDESGATLVEYAVMVSLIAAVCIALITALGTSVKSQFSSVTSGL